MRHRVLRYFYRHGLLERHVTDDMLTWQASGGFSIDASVHVAARDRAGLERLLRYCARPPFALERLVAAWDGGSGERIIYRLPRPAPDGSTALSLTPLEFLERLALLIAPPRVHRHRYHGVLAPNAKLRYQVIALGHVWMAQRSGGGSTQKATRTPRLTFQCEYPDTDMAPTEVTFGLSPRYGLHTARDAHNWFLLMMREHEEFEVETDKAGEPPFSFWSETVRRVVVG